MNTFQLLVSELLKADSTRNSLAEFMGWNVEDGPTIDQANALSVLMGWCPRSVVKDSDLNPVFADTITPQQMLMLFVKHGKRIEHEKLIEWVWNGWHAEQWTVNGTIYFYNPVCKSTAADAYEVLMQI